MEIYFWQKNQYLYPLHFKMPIGSTQPKKLNQLFFWWRARKRKAVTPYNKKLLIFSQTGPALPLPIFLPSNLTIG